MLEPWHYFTVIWSWWVRVRSRIRQCTNTMSQEWDFMMYFIIKKKSVSYIKTPWLYFVDFFMSSALSIVFWQCSFWVLKQLFSQFIVDFPDHSDAQPTSISLHVSNLQSWFLEVNTLKAPDMGCFSAVLNLVVQQADKDAQSGSVAHETFSFYGFSLTINWGYGSIEEMNRHSSITAQAAFFLKISHVLNCEKWYSSRTWALYNFLLMNSCNVW